MGNIIRRLRSNGKVAQAILEQHAKKIRTLAKRAAKDITEIGRRLTECKKIGHGSWLPWLDHEFGWSEDTARNFMRVYELSKSRNFQDLSIGVSTLYLLAAASTPPQAVDEVLERVEAGENVTVADTKNIIKHARVTIETKPSPAQKTTTRDLYACDYDEAYELGEYLVMVCDSNRAHALMSLFSRSSSSCSSNSKAKEVMTRVVQGMSNSIPQDDIEGLTTTEQLADGGDA